MSVSPEGEAYKAVEMAIEAVIRRLSRLDLWFDKDDARQHAWACVLKSWQRYDEAYGGAYSFAYRIANRAVGNHATWASCPVTIPKKAIESGGHALDALRCRNVQLDDPDKIERVLPQVDPGPEAAASARDQAFAAATMRIRQRRALDRPLRALPAGERKLVVLVVDHGIEPEVAATKARVVNWRRVLHKFVRLAREDLGVAGVAVNYQAQELSP